MTVHGAGIRLAPVISSLLPTDQPVLGRYKKPAHQSDLFGNPEPGQLPHRRQRHTVLYQMVHVYLLQVGKPAVRSRHNNIARLIAVTVLQAGRQPLSLIVRWTDAGPLPQLRLTILVAH